MNVTYRVHNRFNSVTISSPWGITTLLIKHVVIRENNIIFIYNWLTIIKYSLKRVWGRNGFSLTAFFAVIAANLSADGERKCFFTSGYRNNDF